MISFITPDVSAYNFALMMAKLYAETCRSSERL